ncbi:MAG: DNA polymerase, partial [Chloroflexota bacterium]
MVESPIERVLARLENVRPSGDGKMAKCPAHDDATESLSICEKEDQLVLLHCFAGCSHEEVLDAIGMEPRDLRPEGGQEEPEAVYDYVDLEGNLQYQVVRFPGKKFRQRRPDGNGGYIWKRGEVESLLYRLPDLVNADNACPVFVVEGEKDADTLSGLGLVATTNPGGAGKWGKAYSQFLNGRSVVVVPDNDHPGRHHAEEVARSLEGIAKEVRILELDGLPNKGDVSDWTSAGGTADQLLALADAVDPIWPKAQRPGPGPAHKPSAGDRRPSQTSLLISAVEDAQFWHTKDLTPYVTLEIDGHRENHAVQSEAFRLYLTRQYFERTSEAPTRNAFEEARETLAAKARFSGEMHEAFVRVAGHEGNVYLDLGERSWLAVEITSSGWGLAAKPPVKFHRPNGMYSLPLPQRAAGVEALWRFLNVSEQDRIIMLAYLLGCLCDRGPYPVLALLGEQGSAKSTTARVVKSLIDPSKAPLRGQPKNAEDLIIAATNSWLVSYDNLSSIPVWLSDALCRLATGGGLSTRRFFTNAEEIVFEVQRPVQLTGIEEFIDRSDLMDRSIVLYLPRITEALRRTERAFWDEFAGAHPGILGLLLDWVAAALHNLPHTDLPLLPRMADFAHWVSSAETAFGYRAGDFLQAYTGNRAEACDLVVTSSPLAQAVRSLAERGPWQGTAADLLAVLDVAAEEHTRREKTWPRTASALSGKLRRLAPDLRASGVLVEFGQTSGAYSRKVITIRKDSDGGDAPTHPDAGTPTPTQQGPGASASTCPAPEEASPCVCADALTGGSVDGVARVDASPASVLIAPGAPATVHRVLETADEVERALDELCGSEAVGIDVETVGAGEEGLDPHRGRIRLIQLATPDQVYLVDARKVDPQVLRPLFDAGNTKVLFNAKFDSQFLRASSVTCDHVFDLMLADQVLHSRSFGRGLADVAKDYLGITLDKRLQVSDWSADLTTEQLAYAASDAAVLLPLWREVGKRAGDLGLEACIDLENSALPAVAWLEYSGAPFEPALWTKVADFNANASEEALSVLGRMVADLAENGMRVSTPPNWDSPKQVLALLHSLDINVERTGRDVLLTVKDKHPIVPALLEYRRLSKLASTYGHTFLKHVHPLTGRIHSDWHQVGAESGRMSSRNPNLQNLPRTEGFRSCFVAPEGRMLVTADYSQLELRIAAEIASDQTMIAAYQQGRDLHSQTAGLLLGIPPEQVDKSSRQKAKAVNFGLVFGMGVNGLVAAALEQHRVVITTSEANEFRSKFFVAYSGIRSWHQSQPTCRTTVRTLSGRCRFGVDQFNEMLNSPVQGTG